jgi:hypothetical protein
VGEVHPFADQALRLADQLGVDGRQERRVVADVVLHHEDDGDAGGGGVVCHVPPVLDVLHDGDQNPRVPLPEEDPLDVRQIGMAGDEILPPVLS